MSSLGKRVYGNVPRVRIPLSPPITPNELSYAINGITSKAPHLITANYAVINLDLAVNTPLNHRKMYLKKLWH